MPSPNYWTSFGSAPLHRDQSFSWCWPRAADPTSPPTGRVTNVQHLWRHCKSVIELHCIWFQPPNEAYGNHQERKTLTLRLCHGHAPVRLFHSKPRSIMSTHYGTHMNLRPSMFTFQWLPLGTIDPSLWCFGPGCGRLTSGAPAQPKRRLSSGLWGWGNDHSSRSENPRVEVVEQINRAHGTQQAHPLFRCSVKPWLGLMVSTCPPDLSLGPIPRVDETRPLLHSHTTWQELRPIASGVEYDQIHPTHPAAHPLSSARHLS